MKGHQIEIEVAGRKVLTLADILPDSGPMKMLFIAKVPMPDSVKVGHYFQGQQGTILWSQLSKYGILEVPYGKYGDDCLLEHGYGITDIVKVPRHFGDEPSDDEYENGIDRIIETISRLKPSIVTFVYKGVLDKILQIKSKRREYEGPKTAIYGFNPDLEAMFACEVFALPLPGVGGTNRFEIKEAMDSLKVKIQSPNNP